MFLSGQPVGDTLTTRTFSHPELLSVDKKEKPTQPGAPSLSLCLFNRLSGGKYSGNLRIYFFLGILLEYTTCNTVSYQEHILGVLPPPQTGFLCVALAILELTLYTRVASNSEIRLPLPPKCWD